MVNPSDSLHLHSLNAGTVYRFGERNGRYQESYELLLNFIASMFSKAFVIE